MMVVLNSKRSSEARRLDSLTGARFIAALGVFLYHAYGLTGHSGVFGSALVIVGQSGSVGVAFFFALSGFVLTWSWRPGDSSRAFYGRRFARIAPAYWVALIYGLIWTSVLYKDPLGAMFHALPAVFGMQAWFVMPDVHFAANGVEWSVSAEMFFYAIFPLVIALLGSTRGRTIVIGTSVLLGFAAPYVIAHAIEQSEFSSWLLDILPAVRVGEFLCGVLLAIAMRKGLRVPVNPLAAGTIFFTCYFLLPFVPSWFPNKAVLLGAILLVIGSLAQRDMNFAAGQGMRRSLLSRSLPRSLGDWSYCFYLVHQVTMQILLFVCAAVLPTRFTGPTWLVLSLVASVGLAALLHQLVERPAERRLRPRRRSLTFDSRMTASTGAEPVADSRIDLQVRG